MKVKPIKIISILLLVAFLAQDIAWAYPDFLTSSKRSTLAVTGLDKPETRARMTAVMNKRLGRPNKRDVNTSFGEGAGLRHITTNNIIAFHDMTMCIQGPCYQREFYENELPGEKDLTYKRKILKAIDMLRRKGVEEGSEGSKRIRIADELEHDTTYILVDMPTHLLLGGFDKDGKIFYQVSHLGRSRRIIFLPKKALDELNIDNPKDIKQLATVLNHDRLELDMMLGAKVDELKQGFQYYEKAMEGFHEAAKADDPFGEAGNLEARIAGWIRMDRATVDFVREEIDKKKGEFEMMKKEVSVSDREKLASPGFVYNTACKAMQIGYAYEVIGDIKSAKKYYNEAAFLFLEVTSTDVFMLPIYAQMNMVRLFVFAGDYEEATAEFRKIIDFKIGGAIPGRFDEKFQKATAPFLKDLFKIWMYEISAFMLERAEESRNTDNLRKAYNAIEDMSVSIYDLLKEQEPPVGVVGDGADRAPYRHTVTPTEAVTKREHAKVRKILNRVTYLAYLRFRGRDVARNLGALKAFIRSSRIERSKEIADLIDKGNEMAALNILINLSKVFAEKRMAMADERLHRPKTKPKIVATKDGKIRIRQGRYVAMYGATMKQSRFSEPRTIYRWHRILDQIFASLGEESRQMHSLAGITRDFIDELKPYENNASGLSQSQIMSIWNRIRYARNLLKGKVLEDKQRAYQELLSAYKLIRVREIRQVLYSLNTTLTCIKSRMAEIEAMIAYHEYLRQCLRDINYNRFNDITARAEAIEISMRQGDFIRAIGDNNSGLTGLFKRPYLNQPEFMGVRNAVIRAGKGARLLSENPLLVTDENKKAALEELSLVKSIMEEANQTYRFMTMYTELLNAVNIGKVTGYVSAKDVFDKVFSDWLKTAHMSRGAPAGMRYWYAKLYKTAFVSERSPAFAAIDTMLIALKVKKFEQYFSYLNEHNLTNILEVLEKCGYTHASAIPLAARNEFLLKMAEAARKDYALDEVEGEYKEDVNKLYGAFGLSSQKNFRGTHEFVFPLGRQWFQGTGLPTIQTGLLLTRSDGQTDVITDAKFVFEIRKSPQDKFKVNISLIASLIQSIDFNASAEKDSLDEALNYALAGFSGKVENYFTSQYPLEAAQKLCTAIENKAKEYAAEIRASASASGRTKEKPAALNKADNILPASLKLGVAIASVTPEVRSSAKDAVAHKALVLYADDVLECGTAADLAYTLKETSVLKDSTIVLYGKKPGNIDLLKKIINLSSGNKNIKIIGIAPEDLQGLNGGVDINIEFADEAKEFNLLLRYISSHHHINNGMLLGVIKGRMNGAYAKDMEAIAGERHVAVVSFEHLDKNDMEKEIYSFREALACLAAIAADASPANSKEWLRRLKPIKMEDIEKAYQDYRRALEVAINA